MSETIKQSELITIENPTFPEQFRNSLIYGVGLFLGSAIPAYVVSRNLPEFGAAEFRRIPDISIFISGFAAYCATQLNRILLERKRESFIRLSPLEESINTLGKSMGLGYIISCSSLLLSKILAYMSVRRHMQIQIETHQNPTPQPLTPTPHEIQI